MGKSSAQRQAEQGNLQLQQQQIQQAQQNANLQSQLLGFQQQQYGAISPFANQALNLGQAAMSGQLPQSFLNSYLLPQRNALAASFPQAQSNLKEQLGSMGLNHSGLGIGPSAYLQSDQARAVGDATANANLNAINSALGLGFQGANLLAGQQAVFNPLQYGSLANSNAQVGTQNLQTNYAPSFGQQALGALGGAFTGAGIAIAGRR